MPTRIRLVLALGAAAVLLMFAVGAGSASAQEQQAGPYAAVTSVHAAGEDVQVSVLRTEYSVTSSQIEIAENGVAVEDFDLMTAADLDRPVELVYVLDVDNRTMVNAGLSTITTGVGRAMADLPDTTKVGLVTAGREAELLSRPSTNRTRIQTALQGAVVEEGAAILDAVTLAAESFTDSPDVVRSVIVVTTGPDTASERSLLAAEAAMIQAGAQMVWINAGQPAGGLDRIVQRTGGISDTAADLATVGTMIGDGTAIAANRLVLTYQSTVERGERAAVDLTIAGVDADFSYPAGLDTDGAFQLAPIVDPEPLARGFFGQPIVMYVSVGLAFLSIALAVWTLGSMFAGGETSLDNLLARYSDRDETLEEDDVQEMLVQTALVRRAVDMTETFAHQRGFLVRVEELLEKANAPVGAGEALFFLSAISVVGAGIGFVMTGSVVVALISVLLISVGGYAGIVVLAKRRLAEFQSQLPDALQLLAGTLRAGYSLPQGLDAVSTEIADPMGYELRRAITEAQLGREIEEALAGIAERLDSPDFAWVVMAIGIQREVGGNLAEVLLTVSETMLQRDRLAREVSALTAEGRVSAGILSMLPPGLGLVMWIMNPAYIGILFERTIGLIFIGLAIASGLTGLIWMKKVITIDV